MCMTSFDLQMIEAEVWERFYNEQDITRAIHKLERYSPEKADEVRAEITEILYSE